MYIYMNRYMTYIYIDICVCYACANHRRLLLSFGIMMINGNICTQRVLMNHVLQLYVYLYIYVCVRVCVCASAHVCEGNNLWGILDDACGKSHPGINIAAIYRKSPGVL